MMKAAAVLCAVVGALVLAGPASSQVAIEGQESVEMKCPDGGMVITDFLDYLKEHTQAKILLDPSNPAVRKKLFWKGVVRIPKSKVFTWCRSVLSFHRMILVPTGPREGNLWSVLDVNAPQIQGHPMFVPAGELPEWKDSDGAYVVTIVTTEHLSDTSRARNALAQLSSRQIGRINDIPSSRSFVIADFAPVAHAMWMTLRKMDDEAAKSPPTGDPGPEVRKRAALERYEEMLAGCKTETAARYFLSLIEGLRSELGEKPVVERD